MGLEHTEKRRIGLSIQSKLMVMLLCVGLLSALIIGVIGFANGRSSLHDAAVSELTTIREARANAVEHAISEAQRNVALLSRDLSTQRASVDFNAAFERLERTPLAPEQREELEAYHSDVFVPALAQASGDQASLEAFIPDSNAGQWLQYLYTHNDSDPAAEIPPVDGDAADGTASSRMFAFNDAGDDSLYTEYMRQSTVPSSNG